MVLCSFVLYGIDIDALYRNAFKFGLVWYYLFLLDKNIVISRKCKTQHIKKKKRQRKFQFSNSIFTFSFYNFWKKMCIQAFYSF